MLKASKSDRKAAKAVNQDTAISESTKEVNKHYKTRGGNDTRDLEIMNIIA